MNLRQHPRQQFACLSRRKCLLKYYEVLEGKVLLQSLDVCVLNDCHEFLKNPMLIHKGIKHQDVKALVTSNFKDAQTCFPGEIPDFIYYIEY